MNQRGLRGGSNDGLRVGRNVMRVFMAPSNMVIGRRRAGFGS
jgi:hypothetical protein